MAKYDKLPYDEDIAKLLVEFDEARNIAALDGETGELIETEKRMIANILFLIDEGIKKGRQIERERILKYLKGLAVIQPQASLLATIDLAEQNNTLQQVYKWGNVLCSKHHTADYHVRRHRCFDCWAELQKEVEK